MDIFNMFNLNNKIFTALQNSENGEVNNQTRFHYFQQDKIIWAEYHGGEIVKGFLIGKWISTNQIEFNYQHVNIQLQNRIGHCITTFIIKQGKLIGQENWQWLDSLEYGQSTIIEVD